MLIQIHKPPMTNVNETVGDDESWQMVAERVVRKMTGCKTASMATQHKLSDNAVQCTFVKSLRGVGNVLGTYVVRLNVNDHRPE